MNEEIYVVSKADVKRGKDRTFKAVPTETGYMLTDINDPSDVRNIASSTFKKSYRHKTADEPQKTEEAPREDKKPHEEVSTAPMGGVPDAVNVVVSVPQTNTVKQGDYPSMAPKDMYFRHDGSGSVFFVKKGDTLAFLNSGEFYEATEEEYSRHIEEWGGADGGNGSRESSRTVEADSGSNEVSDRSSVGKNVGNSKIHEEIDDSVVRGTSGEARADGKPVVPTDTAPSEPSTDKGQVVQSWSLKPKYDKPEGLQKPIIKTEKDVVNANSMRANRDSKNGDIVPYRPANGVLKLRQSMLSSYLQCPDKMYDSYENGYSEDTIFTRVGTAIHGVAEDYYKDPQNADIDALYEKWWREYGDADPEWYEDWRTLIHKYFDTHKEQTTTTVALELEWEVEIDGIPCSGTIDRIDRVDERTIRIVDYKTNFKAWTDEELRTSIQFKFYTLAVRELKHIIGDFEVVECQYDMLRLGISQQTTFDEDDLIEFKKWLHMIWDKIVSGRDRKPRINQYCGYCQKRHKCPVYQELAKAEIQPVLTETTDVESAVADMEKLQAMEKVIKGRIQEINVMIKQKIEENKGEAEIGGYIWSTKAGTRSAYVPSKVIKSLALLGKADLIPDVVSISSTALKNALKGDKETLNAIEQTKVTSYISPSLSKKKVKTK